MSFLGSVARTMGRGAWGATKLGARVGGQLAWKGGLLAGSTALGVGSAAVIGGLALAEGAARVANAGRAVMGPIMPVRYTPKPGPLGIHWPTHIGIGHPWLAAAGVAGAGVGAARGFAADAQSRKWDVNQAMATGQLEVEKPNFLGATGSLTLASYNQRRAGGQADRYRQRHPQAQGQFAGTARAAAFAADDVLLHMLR